MDINVPEELPTDAKPLPTAKPAPFGKKPPERPGSIGSPQAASGGGEGDIRMSIVRSKASDKKLVKIVDSVSETFAPKIYESLSAFNEDEMELIKSYVEDSLFSESDELGLQTLLKMSLDAKSPISIDLPNADEYLKGLALFTIEPEHLKDINFSKYATQLKSIVNDNFMDFLAKSILVVLSEVESERIFDYEDSIDYDYIQQETENRVLGSLDEFARTCVVVEADNIVEQIRNEVEQKWQKQWM
jgi:hypothetical protein